MAERCVDTPVFDAARRERESLLSATMTLEAADDIERLRNFNPRCISANAGGAALGAKAFVVRAPDGNPLLFRWSGGLVSNGRNA